MDDGSGRQHASRRSAAGRVHPIRVIRRGEVVPPPRPGVRHVRVFTIGLVVADDDLRRRVDHLFYWPMIILALAILPLLAWELLWPPEPGTWQWWASAASIAVIWAAFFIEFAIKVAIAECRVEYCRRNWLDIVVLCLPLLRPIRVAALARTSRVFALRGVGMKLLRYVVTLLIGLEATDRFRRRLGVKPARDRRDPMQMTRDELIREVRRTRALIDRWERWHASLVEHLSIHAPGEVAPPPPETLDDALPDSSDTGDAGITRVSTTLLSAADHAASASPDAPTLAGEPPQPAPIGPDGISPEARPGDPAGVQ